MENRIQLIAMLLTEEEQQNSAYIANEIDREKWAESMRAVDDRLAVLGIRLANRPWENVAIRAAGF